MSRATIVTQFLVLALVVLLVVRFSSSSSSDTVAYDQARDLQQAVSQAVAATNDVVIGVAPPQSAATAIDLASAASSRLAESRTSVESTQLRSLATQMVATTDQILTHLRRGDVDRAEKLRAEQLVPLASEVARIKGSAPSTTQASDSGGMPIMTVVYVVAVFIIGGIAASLMRGRDRPVETSPTAGARTSAADPQQERVEGRTWEDPHPLYAAQRATEPTLSENADIARTTRMRPVDIELRALLESTIEQAREREWAVSLVCPDVHIAGDPVRVQRAILATLGNAFLEGAELVGIVVDVVDTQVLLSIGHDAPIDDQKAESIAIRLASQLAYALSEEELGWSVASDGEIYLTTVSAGADRVIEAGAEIPA